MNSFIVLTGRFRMHRKEQRRAARSARPAPDPGLVGHLGVDVRVDGNERAVLHDERRSRRPGDDISAPTDTAPLPPARFSTTTFWPIFSCSRLPTMRATVSGSPPGAAGMMKRMVWLG